MWWGGGGSKDSQVPPKEEDPTRPIAIAGRRRRGTDDSSEPGSPPSSSPLSGSLASSYGSPGGDLAEMRDLKNNFSNQEQLLGQLRDVLQSNNQRLQSKEREVQDYASRLAQMRSNRKGGQGAVPKVVHSGEPIQEEDQVQGGKKTRMQMLRKQLEESKARQAAEASSRQDLENIVAGLQKELEERDSMIQNMQLGSVSTSVTSSVLGSPFVMSPEQGSPTDSPGNTTPPAGYSEGYGSSASYHDLKELVSAKDNKILEQNEQIAYFNRRVWDLEESLKEKDEIITARTQAVGLASASLAAKGKDTLDQLEDTRKELRTLQENWSTEQGDWKREREETRILLEGANARVESLQEANKRLERSRDEIGSKNQELRVTLCQLEEELSALKSRSREEKILLEAKVEEVEEEKNSLQEKIKKKEDIFEKRLETMQQRNDKLADNSDDDDKIAELENALAEAEEERGALQLKLVDLEEMTAAEQKLKVRVRDAEENSRRVGDELDSQRRAASMAEAEKIDLMEAVATRDTEIEALQMEISKLVLGKEESARGRLELEIRCVQLEEEKDRWESEKQEILQQIEDIKNKASEDLLPYEELKTKHSDLLLEQEKFSQEYEAAMERSKLYDKDMLEKTRKIKEQSIDLKTLENLLHEKTKEITYQLSEVDLKEKELNKVKDSIVNFENVISQKEMELTELKSILDESGEHSKLIDLKVKVDELEKDLTLLIEDKSTLENEIETKNNQIETLQHDFNAEIERLNGLLEQNNIENVEMADNKNELTKRIQELQETIESQTIEIKEREEKLNVSNQSNKDLTDEKIELESGLLQMQEQVDSLNAMLEDQNMRHLELQNSLDSKIAQNEELCSKMNDCLQEISTLKDSTAEYEKSINQKVTELQNQEKELKESVEKIKVLEAEVNLKSEEFTTMNEEVMSKYKIIEDLQNQIESLTDSNAKENDAKSINERLLAELNEMKQRRESDNEVLLSNANALERLQTVIDVCEEQNRNKDEELCKRDKEISHLKKEVELLHAEKPIENESELTKLNLQLEEMSITMTSLQQMKDAYEAKIDTLENENKSLEDLSVDIAEYRKKILEKDEEIESLKEKLEATTSELSRREADNFEAKQQQIGKLFEKHEVEQVEMLQQQLKEKDDFYEKQKKELIEKHKSQLEEKKDFDAPVSNNDELKQKMDEINTLLKSKTEEILHLSKINDEQHMENVKLETRMAEIEQFRQEVAKEANQHMEETGDKMRELKVQFENKQDEVNQLISEKEKLESNLQRTSDELESTKEKCCELMEKSSHADIIKEKDLLKEKNEKLTNMCKKYLAKLKQQESVLKEKEQGIENDKIEEFNQRILNFEKEIEQAKSENSILMEEMTSKYQIIEDLQSQISEKETEYENLQKEFTDKELRHSQSEAEKDDIIRNLKHKLEETPEDISIPVNVAEAALAHERTKTELLNLKEKCKKLIVKIKQQDALIKRKGRDSTSSEASVNVNDDNDALIQENEKLKKELEKLKEMQEELSVSKAKEIEILKAEMNETKKTDPDPSFVADMEELKATNQKLLRQNEELVEGNKTREGALQDEISRMEQKLDFVKKERSTLNDDHITLKDSLKELKRVNHTLEKRAEDAINELKKVRENNILTQMAASSMLHQERDRESVGDLDDGWGSPKPETDKPSFHETESDGWGGWEENENDVLEKNPDEEDGLKNVNEVQHEQIETNEGWGGWDEELATPTPDKMVIDESVQEAPAAFPDGPRNDGAPLVEREADIEDGWGDDSWGGFGADTIQGDSALAANLRISEKDDDGLEDVQRETDAERDREQSAPSSLNQALQLQGKIAEKESVIESLENNLKITQQKLDMIEEELITTQDQKDEAEQQLSKVEKIKLTKEAENVILQEKIDELVSEIERNKSLDTDLEQLKNDYSDIMNKLKEQSEEKETMEMKIQSLEEKERDLESLQGVEKRYKECLDMIRTLEEQNIQADMNAEAVENGLKVEVDKKINQISSLEAELKNLNEQLEQKENRLTDLNEMVGHLSERRNSLDSTVINLQSTLSAQKDEIADYKTKMDEMQVQGDKTEEIAHINEKMQNLMDQLHSKNEETQQLTIARDNLFTEIGTLKAKYNEQMESNSASLNKYMMLENAAALAEKEAQKTLKEKLDLEKDLSSLRTMVMDITTENETLQSELISAQRQMSSDQDRINQLESDLNSIPRPAVQHPPPDITNNGQQPDVAARNINPDIMRGPINPGPDIMQPQINANPDIMGGIQPMQQPLDLVQEPQGWGWGGNNDAAEAASWFDDFEVDPAPNPIPQVEQAQIQQASTENRNSEFQQQIEEQLRIIQQQETKIQELEQSIVLHEDTAREQVAKINQYKSSDENNLKVIGQLEANIWTVTDEKHQMSLIKESIEKEIRAMVEEIDNLKRKEAQNKNECEQLRSQVSSNSTLDAELAQKTEQLHMTQTSFQQLQQDYDNIFTELQEIKSMKTKVEDQASNFQNIQNLKMSESAPVPINSDTPKTENNYQSPPPAVFNWNAVAEIKQDNASSMFAQNVTSAASFFEDLDTSAGIPQAENFFEGIDSPQQAVVPQAPVYAQEPQPNSPHSNSFNELRNLQDQLRMRVVQSEQLAANLNEIKHQLEVKQSETDKLQKALEQTQQEKINQTSELQKSLQMTQEVSALNEALKCELSSLKTAISDSSMQIENLKAQLSSAESVESASKIHETPTTISSQVQNETSTICSQFQQEESTSTSTFFAQPETSGTASLFEQTDSSDAPFLGQESSQPAEATYAGQPQDQSTASYFNDNNTPTAATLFEQTINPSTLDQVEQTQQASTENSLPSVDQLKPEEMLANLTWYQAELAQYQQACTDWQAWGETKTQEINDLNENLQYQIEAFGIKKAENEKLQKKIQEHEERTQKIDNQNLLKLKELEVLDLKETVERIESEKEELTEEINDMRNTIDELRNISENVESYKDDSDQLADARNNLEAVEKERKKLLSDLTDLRNEMATTSFSNDKTIKDLRNEMEERNQEIHQLMGRDTELKETIQALETSLADEKRMQEEIGDEYEAMQQQVQDSSAKISDLTRQIEVLEKEADSSRSDENKDIDQESIKETEDLKKTIAEITTEMEQYKQACLDWNVWSETKIAEYDQLLQAYNQYMEAYNTLKAEHDILQQSASTNEESSIQNKEDDQTADNKDVSEELEKKEKEFQVLISEKDEQINKLQATLESKDHDLEDFIGMEERYKESLKNVEDLERQMVQADMDAEIKEQSLQKEINEKESLLKNLQEQLKHVTEDDTKGSKTEDAEQLKRELDEKYKEFEAKTLEYNTLYEAYNQYVVAYEHLNNEYANVKRQLEEISAQSGSTEDTRSIDLSRQQDLESKNKEIQILLANRDSQIEELRQKLAEKEKELVDKTCTVAKLSIGSALSKSLQIAKQSITEVPPVVKTLEISNQASENIMPEAEKSVEVKEPEETPWEESEGWGVEETSVQQSSSSEVILLETEICELRQSIRILEEEKSKTNDDLNAAKVKNGKFLLKVKQLTKEIETLKKNKNVPAELDDLDKALQDEMKHQANKVQSELNESRKEVDSLKLEKENLTKRLDTLETANERFIEMKEKQDNEVEFLQHKNKDLENRINGLNWNITELEEQSKSEIDALKNKLAVFTNEQNENLDSNQLKIEIANLTSQLSEAHQESNRLRADLTAINEALVLAQAETATVKSQIIDLQDSIDRLINEKESLKLENESLKDGSVSGSESFEEIQKLNETLNSEITSLKHYIENQNVYGHPPAAASFPTSEMSEVEHLKHQLQREQQLVLQLEQDLQAKESSLELLESELMNAREQKTQHESELKASLGSPRESIDREIFSAFSDKDLVAENLRLKADLDSSMRERRQMAGCIQNWTQELNRTDIGTMSEDDLRQELKTAIKTLQIKDHKCEEVTQENIRLIEERDTLMLKLSTVMRQLEGSRAASAMSSMAGSRTTTPVPGAMPSLMPHFDPHAEIRGLHAKLEELRRLNYSLDIELQRERGDRAALGQRVMAPRSRHASQILPDSKKSDSPEKVQHI